MRHFGRILGISFGSDKQIGVQESREWISVYESFKVIEVSSSDEQEKSTL